METAWRLGAPPLASLASYLKYRSRGTGKKPAQDWYQVLQMFHRVQRSVSVPVLCRARLQEGGAPRARPHKGTG